MRLIFIMSFKMKVNTSKFLGRVFCLGIGLFFFNAQATELRNGDIIFHRSQSSQSSAIQLATRSDYTHVGMVVYCNHKPYVIEAVQPVMATPLDQWIKRGLNSDYVVKRLKNADTLLTASAKNKLNQEASYYLGKDYDWKFGWSDDKIYCSELVWKVYQRALGIELCHPKKLADYDLSSPAVKQEIARRYGNSVPLNEPVVAPSDLFDSDLLVQVIL